MHINDLPIPKLSLPIHQRGLISNIVYYCKYSIRLLEMAFQPPTLCHYSHPSSSRLTEKGCASATIPDQFLCGAKLDPV